MDEQDGEAAMREMMGFGSFGSNKRQKLNTGKNNRPPKPPATSSNSTPLGTPRNSTPKVSEDYSLVTIPNLIETQDEASAKSDNAAVVPVTVTQASPSAQTVPLLTTQGSQTSVKATAESFTPQTSSHFSASDIRSDPSYWTSTMARHDRENEVAYTSPWTGTTLTRKELTEYGRGKKKVHDDGSAVNVFFKPGFLASEDDLWGRLIRKGQGEQMH